MLLMRSTNRKSIVKFPSLLYCCAASSLLCQTTTTATIAAAAAAATTSTVTTTTTTTTKTTTTFATVASSSSSSSINTAFAFTTTPSSSRSTFRSRRRLISTKMVSSKGIIGKTLISVDDAIKLHNNNNQKDDQEDNDIKFIDGSWFLKGRNGREEFIQGPRIQGAQYFDIDDISTPSHLPHMMPSKSLFEATMDAMNISNNDHIIVYGSKDCMFVHRAWFQIRNMGHGQNYCHLLDGSIGDWMEQGGPIEKEGTEPSIPMINAKDLDLSKPTTTKYQAKDAMNIIDLNEMKELVSKVDDDDNPTTTTAVDAIWIDARSKDRFLGLVEEPRPGMRLGHMPGAKNVFFLDLLDTNNNNVNKLKPQPELQQILEDADIDLSTNKRIIVSCGSGATACTVVAALEVCGVPTDQCYVYDGSWSEWGALDDTPIVK